MEIYAPTFDPPQGVQLTCREDSELGYVASLSWDEPAGRQKPEGYIVYCNGLWAAYGITETNFEQTGLTKGVYEYAVSAIYDTPWGESEAVGDAVAIGTRMPVRDLRGVLGDGQVALTWQAPADSRRVPPSQAASSRKGRELSASSGPSPSPACSTCGTARRNSAPA